MSIPSITNCPNCGAPIDRSRDSCEYCGTPYEKSNDIHIEVTAPDPNIDDFIESLSRMSRCGGFNLMDSTTKSSIQATQQELMSGIASAIAWQPTPEEERKMIKDMCNVAPIIFPKVEPKVELVSDRRIDKLFDTVWFPILLSIVTILLAALPFIL